MGPVPKPSSPSGDLVPSEDLVPRPPAGRVFETTRRVSIADATATGRMELDAITRFLQDAGNDDTDDAGLEELGLAWVARRTVIEILEPARSRELLGVATWCSGTGRRWAERRTSLTGEAGARIEAAALWVHVDVATGRPVPWGDAFARAYLDAAGGREVDSRLRHPRRPPDSEELSRLRFRFRRTDLDAFGHVNNATYLAVLEESLGGHEPPKPLRVEIEWRRASDAGEELEVVELVGPDGVQQWICHDGEVRATISARPLR